MTYTIETKDYVHIPEHSSYNHNYYRNIYTGEVILEEYKDDGFGTYYNFRNYKIDINYAYQYVPLNSNDGYQTNSVVIIDPLSGLNASKSSYRIEDIQRTFFDAFNYLVQMKKEYEGEPEKDNKNYIYGMYGK